MEFGMNFKVLKGIHGDPEHLAWEVMDSGVPVGNIIATHMKSYFSGKGEVGYKYAKYDFKAMMDRE